MPRSTEIWDLPSGKMQMTISGSAAALALDPEGTLMAYGPYDSTVYLLDLKQRKILFSIKTTDPEIRKMQFSDDGKKLAIAFGDPTRFMVVDVQTGKILKKITTDLSSAIFIWFSENAAVVSVGDNNEHLETWNWQDSLKTRQVRLTENGSMPFFSPNHKLLFYYKNDKIVEIRDFEKGKTIGQVNRPNLYAQAFFSADNSMLYFIEHLSLLRYHIATGKRDTVQIPDFKMRYSTYGSQWSFAPYSNYLINTEFMRIWNLTRGVALPMTPRHDTPTMSNGLRIHTCFSADGIKMYSVKDPLGLTTVEVITWNTITQQPVSSIRVPDFTNKDLVLSPDDRYFAVVPHNMASDSIRIWDILLKKTVLSLPFKGEYRVVFSPDSRYLYTCDGSGQMSCFTLPKGEKASLPDAPSFYRINDLLFSADHKHLLTVNTTGVLTLLQYPSLKPLTTMQANIKEGAFISTAVSADGTLVAGLPGGNEIDIWDGITGQLLHTLKDTASVFFTGPVFSPDNKYLYVAGTDEAVHVFDLKTGVFAYCIPQGFSVSGMEFIRNQPNILTVTGQGQVRFWDIQK
jgi:WD40 repeat protein